MLRSDPFFTYTNQHDTPQIGTLLTARKQWSERYVSVQGLYGLSVFRTNTAANDAILALTYGQNIGDSFAGSMTLSGGYTWADFQRSHSGRTYKSHPSAWSLGLSPLLVYYMPTKVPLDLFLGGDVYYAHRFSFDEHSRGVTCTYDAHKELLWRIKAGPSYNMKREGKRRLYQLKTALGFNVQSPVPDRFTVAPNILFESQPIEGRGGYLFNLGINLGATKKSWSLAYGLRF